MAAHPLILITGSSDGIGLETARQLLERGAEVILHGRSAERIAAARRELAKAGERELPEPSVGDLSSLSGARQLAADLEARGLFPTVLINNAGVYRRTFERSPDGIELTMAINHFAHFVLTRALLAQRGCRLERVVNVSSQVHTGGKIDLEDLTLVKRSYDAYGAYAASKLANVLFTVELARRTPGIAVNALHPGVVSTKLLTEGFGARGHDSLADSARTSVMLAWDEDYRKVTGQYFAHERPGRMAAAAHDAEFARGYFDLCEALVAKA